ncbi:MAG: MoaD/ThiS family protein [Candidatus Bathyarchaeia archaeon]
MKVKVKLFGSTREAVGQKEAEVTLQNEPITVAELKSSLFAAYPALASDAAYLVVAVNMKVADDTATVISSDELALLPLVSGG